MLGGVATVMKYSLGQDQNVLQGRMCIYDWLTKTRGLGSFYSNTNYREDDNSKADY
jgi:hypothetical protein